MSFATLSSTLAECSAISRLEITKNPFDSDMELDRLNLPAMSSPSIFVKQETPASQKRGFRWSIEQISKLDPADIDEFPNQEYSSTYERPEDESRAQEAINEYFSRGTILPSPWTPDSYIKHVTFSPLPPSTAYISGDEDSMTDVSQNSSTSSKKQSTDASCQTKLTLPPLFDLTKLLDSGYYSYVEDEAECSTNRELNVSSLRRKLFSQDDSNSPVKNVVQPSPKERVTRSILKSPSPKNLVTSSPRKTNPNHLHPDFNSPFSKASKTSPSPEVSPIKSPPPQETCEHNSKENDLLEFDTTLSNEDLLVSDVLESSDICINPSLLPDISPIKGRRAADLNDSVLGDDVARDEKWPCDLSDGGPLKLSDLSDIAMDYNNDDIKIAHVQPLTSTQHKIHPIHKKLPAFEEHFEKDDAFSRRKSNIFDVISRSNNDVVSTSNNDVMSGRYRGAISSDSNAEVKTNQTNNDVIPLDDLACNGDNDDVILRLNNDVSIPSTSKAQNNVAHKHDVNDNLQLLSDVTSANDVAYENRPPKESDFVPLQQTRATGKDMGDNKKRDGYLRAKRTARDACEPNKENVVENGDYFSSHVGRITADKRDDELVQRASAAIRRADKLVHETCMEQGALPRGIGTGNGYLNWSRVNSASLWHPIDMSTPVVSGKLNALPPLTTDIADSNKRVRRQISDPDCLDNLLSSFANSKLENAPRSYSGPSDSGVETAWPSADNYSRTRGRLETRLETRRRRYSADVGLSATLNSPRNGRYGYNGKRSSWPLWKTSRHCYATARSVSPTFPSGPLRPRNKLNSRYNEGLGRFPSRPHEPADHYGHYYDGMHSTSRKSYIVNY